MSSNSGPKSNLVEIGALWYSTKTPGVMTGKLGNARLVLLPNDRKEGSQPDCRIFVAPFEKQDQQKPRPQRTLDWRQDEQKPRQQQPRQQQDDVPW